MPPTSAGLEQHLPNPETRPLVVTLPGFENAPTRFRILSRVSDDKLRSLPQQIKDCETYANNLPQPPAIDGLYNLGEHSGFSMNASEVYRQLLDDALHQRFHGLIVRDSSRLGRDYWEKMGTLRDLRASKIELHIVEDGGKFDFEDRLEKVKNFASSWADEEKKREEIRKSIRATNALREDGLPTVKPPYGYTSTKHPERLRRVWRPNEHAPTVRAIFAAIIQNPNTNRSELGRQHNLKPYQIQRIIQNQSYTGGYTWQGKFVPTHPDIIPPLIDNDTYRRANEKP